jgi:MSHA biogenesis protein MshL
VKQLNKKFIFLFISSIGLLLLVACKISEPSFDGAEDAIDQALRENAQANKLDAAKKNVPASVSNALMPDIDTPDVNTDSSAEEDDDDQYFDIAVNNVPAKDFFMGLVKDTKYNITVSSQVVGNVSLDLKGVSVPQAMEAVRNIYGFEYETTSYGYQVFPRRLETRIFNVNYLNIERSGQSQTSIGSGQITNTVQNTLTSSGVSSSQQTGSIPSGLVQTTTTSNFWELLKQNLLTIIGTQDGKSIVVNPESGSIIIKAYPDELRSVAQYLDGIQNIMQRQVIIEAKVLEVELNAAYQAGIDWKVLGLRQTTQTNSKTSDGTNFSPSILPLGTFSLTATQSRDTFTTAINLLSAQGNVNVLSSPRVATVNNQKAVIKVGDDSFYVTNISSNTNNNSSSSGSNTTASVTLTPFFSGISLDVTPQVDEDGIVTLHIHPIVSNVTEEQKSFTISGVANNNIPLAKSSVRESDSIVRAKNGQIIVIGGLMINKRNERKASTPGIDRIPIIGDLARNTEKIARKFELIILLRPIVVGDAKTWQKQLTETAHRMRGMKNSKGNFNYDIVPVKRKNKQK